MQTTMNRDQVAKAVEDMTKKQMLNMLDGLILLPSDDLKKLKSLKKEDDGYHQVAMSLCYQAGLY